MDRILDYGYGVDIDFIFGLPEEREEDIHLTIDFFKDVLHSTKKIRIHTHAFMPLPGTPYQYEQVGIIREDMRKYSWSVSIERQSFGSHEKQAVGLT